MKYIVNETLRIIVKIALNIYYKKIYVEGRNNIPKGKAILMVSNHQNALIDPLLLATHAGLKPYFLTRASVFGSPFVAKLLDFIQMFPIYRVRDGVKNMEKNQVTFDKSVNVLLKKGTMLIFGEGSHSTLRNLRALKKGFSRIAFQAIEKDEALDLVVLPVAINYSNHNHSGSKVRISFGEVIDPKEYFPNHDTLIKTTSASLEPMIVELPEQSYHEDLQSLIDHKIDLTSPKAVSDFLNQNTSSKQPSKKVKKPYLRNKLMKLFHLPIYWVWLWMSPKVKDIAFIATFKFVIGLVGLPVWYATVYFSLTAIGHQDWAVTYLFLAILFLFTNKNGQA